MEPIVRGKSDIVDNKQGPPDAPNRAILRHVRQEAQLEKSRKGNSLPPSLLSKNTDRMTHVFRSTRVVTPSGIGPATVMVEKERISAIGEWSEVPALTMVHEFGDLVLLPGLVDSHVHINEPGRTEWEGFATATRAAAAGGVTTLVDMPLNCVPEITTVQALEAK